MSNLGLALRARGERTGSQADLDEAITVSRNAEQATSPEDPHRADRLSNLGLALRARFELAGDQGDLDEAISSFREAVQNTPLGSGDLAGRLANLGVLLRSRFERTWSREDLDEAIAVGVQAIQAAHPKDPNLAGILSNLGTAVRVRFEQTGSLPDLHEAITLGHQAVRAAPHDHPHHAGWLSNLGLALRVRGERTGSQADLDEAITISRNAEQATSPEDPHRADRLSNLGLALRARFELTGDQADLDEAITISREAVQATPSEHPYRAVILTGFGTALYARHGHAGSQADLHQAIIVGRQALQATPPEDPHRADRLSNLGLALRARFELTGDQADLDEAIRLFSESAQSWVASPSVVCQAASTRGRLTEGDEAIRAFDTAIGLLPRVSARWLSYDDALSQGQVASALGVDAAAAFIAAGQVERALSAVEHARAFAYSHVLQSRPDLTDLEAAHPELADRVAAALAVLNGDTSQATAASAAGVLSPAQITQARREADADLEAALVEVRGLGGKWARFFLPPTIEELTNAAAGGPVVVLNISGRRCDALVLTSSGVDLVELPDLTEDEAVEHSTRFLRAVNTISSDTTSPEEAEAAEAAHEVIRGVCAWMWDAITAPVLGHLGHRTPQPASLDYTQWPRIWWIPTGPLVMLPIHAAGHHARPTDPLDTSRTVIDRVISSTLPTITTLLTARTRPNCRPQAQQVLLVGMPHTPPLGKQSIPDQPGVLPDGTVQDLPGVTEELAALGEALDATPTHTLLEGDLNTPAPTKSAVLAALPRHAWAHLACHAITNPERPTQSALLLTDYQDDLFTVLDLTQTPLPDAQLLFLSACTTARTGHDSLDEPVHFAAAALLAGYRHVIATQWPLLDTTAPEIADNIYAHLTTNGQPTDWTADLAAISLHHAIHDQRRTPGTTPYHWATHTHSGP